MRLANSGYGRLDKSAVSYQIVLTKSDKLKKGDGRPMLRAEITAATNVFGNGLFE